MPRMRVEDRAESVRLDPGKNYYWKCVEAEHAFSRNSGDEQIRLTLMVGDRDGQVKIFETLTFSEKAYFRIEQFLKSAGKYPRKDVEIYFESEDCIGLKGGCTIKYEHNEQKNRDYARLDQWLESAKQVPDQAWIDRAKVDAASSSGYSDDDYVSNTVNNDDIPF